MEIKPLSISLWPQLSAFPKMAWTHLLPASLSLKFPFFIPGTAVDLSAKQPGGDQAPSSTLLGGFLFA